MTTTGTTAFNPALGEIVLNAFGRIGVRRPELLATHMQDARVESNLLQAEWNNRGVNLWKVDQQTQVLTQGTATYSVPTDTVMILDAYLETGTAPDTTDLIIFPISRTEYASIPDKGVQARPTQFWFDRLESPTITLWPTPDGNGPYTLVYYRYGLIQDAALVDGTTVDIPQLWLDAFAAGLAYRLSRIYAPEQKQDRKMDYDEAWTIAATQNVENTPLYIVPGTAGYWRP